MITEDLDLFFADFGISFTAGAISGLCIKNMDGMGILDDRVMDAGDIALGKTSEFGQLSYNDFIVIDNIVYLVKDAPRPVEDGVFSLITLERSEVQASIITILDGDFL